MTSVYLVMAKGDNSFHFFFFKDEVSLWMDGASYCKLYRDTLEKTTRESTLRFCA